MTINEVIIFIILGIAQGITEILPISSSGHLIILGTYFGIINENPMLDVYLHFASLVAIIIFLRKELKDIFVGTYKYLFKKDKESREFAKMFLFVFLSTLVTGVFGLILKQHSLNFKNPLMVSIFLILNASILLVITKIKPRYNPKMTYKDALLIGAFQGVGILPGISRSGITIGSGVILGIEKEKMYKYSFLLFIPASIGATILSIGDIVMTNSNFVLGYFLSFVFATVTTLVCLKLFLEVVRKNKTNIFAYYCYLLAIAVIVYEVFIKS